MYKLGYKAWELWRDDIDFFLAEDIYALIDAVANSDKPVHFVILDDQVSYLDARNPMGNKNMTQIYFTIAHELKNRAKLMGGNHGGLVICMLLTQEYGAIDLRLRKDAMFTIFKTHDEAGLKYYQLYEPELDAVLIDLEVRSNRLTEYEARKWAFVIDKRKEGCFIYFDATDYINPDSPDHKKLPFTYTVMRGVDRYREQRDRLVQELVNNYPIFRLSDKDIKSELYTKLDTLEDAIEICRISPSNFTEIVLRARKLYKQQHKPEIDALRKEQKETLVEFLYNEFAMEIYQDAELKGELFYRVDELKKEYGEENVFIKRRDFLEIIYRAKKKYLDHSTEAKEKEELSPQSKSLKERMEAYFKFVKSICTLKVLYREFECDYSQDTIRKTLNNYPETFLNLSNKKELNLKRGVYCLVGYEWSKEELEPYEKETIKTLEMHNEKEKIKAEE